jgi:hypothetical protein
MTAAGFAAIRSRTLGIALASLVVLAPAAGEVPVEEAFGIYEHTIESHRNLSPLWGLLALESGVLANVRFFGNYGTTPRDAYPAHPAVAAEPGDDHPQDAIAAVLQYLFPSPDGASLVANERNKDPIGEIAIEQRSLRSSGKGEGGLRKLRTLLDASLDYRRRLATHPDTADPDFRHAVDRILAPKEGGTPFKTRDLALARGLRQHFARMLQEAVREEIADAGTRYPPDIVEVALLAYAWRTAEHVGELYQAFAGLLEAPATPLRRFDETQFRAGIGAFEQRMAEAAGSPPSPEAVFLFTHGIKVFGRKGSHAFAMPDLLSYAQATHEGRTYPDCGETSLRNFFMIILSRRGILDPERLADLRAALAPGESKLERKAVDGNFHHLERFFTTFGSPSAQRARTARNAWDQVVANLNRSDDPLPIEYRDTTHNLSGTGIENMLNLMAHLLPDPVLNQPWSHYPDERPEMTARKLDAICRLVSRKDRDCVLDWDVGGRQEVPAPIVTVRFTLNGAPAFTWGFLDRHFVLRAYDRPMDLGFSFRPPEFLLRAWLQRFQGSRYALAPAGPGGSPPGPPAPEPMSQVYAEAIHTPEIALGLVQSLFRSGPAHWPTGSRILARAVVPDLIAVQALADLLAERPDLRTNPDFYPMVGLNQWPQVDRDALLQAAVHGSCPEQARLLLDHGANPNSPPGEPSLLSVAIRARDGEALLDLLLARKPATQLDVLDNDGSTPLLTALEKGRGLQKLLDAGADPNFIPIAGNSPLTYVVLFNKLPEAKALLRAGADPHQKANIMVGGRTPYESATALGRTEMLDLFDHAAEGKAESKREARGPAD